MKIGLVLGLILVAVVALRLATHPRLSPEARMLNLHSDTAGPGVAEQPVAPAAAENPSPQPEAVRVDNGPIRSKSAELDTLQAETTNHREATQDGIQDSTIFEQDEKIKAQRFHIVRKGDTLSEISYKYYGSANKWPKILEANRKTIKDPKKIPLGTKLIIPD